MGSQVFEESKGAGDNSTCSKKKQSPEEEQ